MERGAISQLNADRSTGRLVRLRYRSAEISFNARDVPDGGFEQLQVGQLVKHGYLERHGMGRGTFYTVVEE